MSRILKQILFWTGSQRKDLSSFIKEVPWCWHANGDSGINDVAYVLI